MNATKLAEVSITSKVVLGLALAMLCASPVLGDVVKYTASLSGSGSAKGLAHFTYDTDTKQLDYFVTYENLSGPASGGGIEDHSNMILHFPVPESPISGTTTLDSSQAQDLSEGRFSVEIETSAFPQGEIHGQIQK